MSVLQIRWRRRTAAQAWFFELEIIKIIYKTYNYKTIGTVFLFYALLGIGELKLISYPYLNNSVILVVLGISILNQISQTPIIRSFKEQPIVRQVIFGS